MVLNIFSSLIAAVDFGNLASRKNIKNEPGLVFHSGITNLTDCLSVCQKSIELLKTHGSGFEIPSGNWILGFIDTLIMFCRSAEEHDLSLENVLQSFDEANIQLNPGMCVFAKSEVQYLGFVLSENGVSVSTDKVKTMQKYPTPKNANNVRAFLGLASFYRRLLPNFAEAARHVTTLTRKTKTLYGPHSTGGLWGY